jgi:glycosyltransferase involved in cell wall biosynthesis
MSNLFRCGFVIEQSMLGHITYTQNLKESVSKDSSINPTWMLVPLDQKDRWQIVPRVSTRLSLRARGMVSKAIQNNNLDCLFYHTPMISMFSLQLMQQIPTILSLDSTPFNFNTIAASYQSKVPTGVLARLKFEWYRKIFHSAAGFVVWSHWVKQSLDQDYGIDPDKVKVIYPGIPLDLYTPTIKKVKKDEPLRLLFIGGDFKRKGGYEILKAFRKGLADFCQLDIVTKDKKVSSEKSVNVYHGLPYKGEKLMQLHAEADIFVFPTWGDTNGNVILEAMAAGLPVISTNVGAIPEEVEDGVNGFIVPVKSPDAIVKAVRSLAENPELRIAMGRAARAKAELLFDAEQNNKALLDATKEFTIRASESRQKSALTLR